MQTVKIGKVELQVATTVTQYVPKNSGTFVDHGNMLNTLAIAIRDNLSALLIGQSGTGKTSAIRYIAGETKHGLRRVNLNGGTTADELVGRLLLNEKGTYWVDGVLTEAMRNGDWIVLDEINAALPEVLFVLQSIMDDDGYLVLNEKEDKEIVYKHPEFRLFATCNPPEYAGTKEMNQALLSRFTICINAAYPPVDVEMNIIKHHLGAAISESNMAIKLVGLANETRKTKELGTTDYAINTRDILNTLKLIEQMDPLEALDLAFSNKLEPGDAKALRLLSKLHLPLTKKKAMMTKKPLKDVEELTIGSEYTFETDISAGMFLLNESDTLDTVKNIDLGVVIKSYEKNAQTIIKNEQLLLVGLYFEKCKTGVSLKPSDKLGSKAASIVKITSGKLKDRLALMLHHPLLNNSDKIVENISLIG